MINSLATMGMSFTTDSKGLPVILFLIIVFIKCQSRVVVSEWKTDNKLFLNCSVCELVHDVILYSPSSYPVSFSSPYFAICQADSHNKGVRKCTDLNVSQDFATHTTSFMIGDVNVFKKYGIWTCRHGSDQGHIELKLPESESECEDKLAACWIFSAVLPMFTILSIVLNVYLYCKCRKGPCWQLRKTNLRRRVEPRINFLCVKGQSTEYDQHKGMVQKDTETQSEKVLLIERQSEDADSFTEFETCHSCKHFWPNAVCINCKTEYCGTCLESHNAIYPEHNVLNKIDSNELEINCRSCQDDKASMICKKCNANLCKVCADKRSHNNKQLTGSTRKCCDHEDVEYIRKILMPAKKGAPIRICGIAFLVENRIVAENGCYRVSVFKNGQLKFEEDLLEEPRGITGMTENNIAITFGFKMLIQIYKVEKRSLSKMKTINVRSFGLGNIKPFSISFDKNHFAVEAGEGDDGVILIINVDGVLKHKIVNRNNLAFFTGNTIRLALNMSKERVYISGISKKAVSCITFSGRIVWNVPMQSPRSVVFIPPGEIICASKCCDGIF